MILKLGFLGVIFFAGTLVGHGQVGPVGQHQRCAGFDRIFFHFQKAVSAEELAEAKDSFNEAAESAKGEENTEESSKSQYVGAFAVVVANHKNVAQITAGAEAEGAVSVEAIAKVKYATTADGSAGRSDNHIFDEAVEWAEEVLDPRGGGRRNPRSAPPTPVAEYTFVKNDSEHCHVAMGLPAYGASDERRIPAMMLSAVLGSGTSSRLFQAVREEKALVYSVYNTITQCSDASSFATYMSCTDDNVIEAMETVARVYSGLLKEGLEKGELDRAKRLLKGANVRSMESTESRMYRLAVNHMLDVLADTGYEGYVSLEWVKLDGSTGGLEERLERIDAVTEEQVMAVAEDILRSGRLNTVVLGKGNRKIKGFDRSCLDF